MKQHVITFILFFSFSLGFSQEMPIEYGFGEKYNDRYKYSNLVAQAEDGQGGYLMVRAYYSGLILSPKGYLIEHYNQNLELASEYNYKLKGKKFVHGYVRNGQLYLIFLDYNYENSSYQYSVHRSPFGEFSFTEEHLLSIASDEVRQPYDRNYYNRNFNSGFTTTLLHDDNNSVFLISTHFKKGKRNQHYIHVYDASLNKVMEHDLSSEVETKNYAFEHLAVSEDLSEIYIMGKAYFKKKRIGALERKFQYELIQISQNGAQIQNFLEDGKYIEGLKPVFNQNQLLCVGFYSDKRNKKYNGLVYFNVEPGSMQIKARKYNAFSDQFVLDKFGKESEAGINNLVFKNVSFTPDNGIVFNAEEYFVTQSVQSNSSGGRVRVERFHHNDIVCAKLNSNGDLVWARNINKTEVTQGDGAYASYSSYTKNGDTYFFICTANEAPDAMTKNRLMFKQGISRNRNIFTVKLDSQGNISYEKIIDNAEARLPIMVSKPLVNKEQDQLWFYAKRGSKKQLVSVSIK
ncbi:MAG: hypothetical protein HKN89_05840 [Eudoraea sp.]|nr:hypothetical protein [Eudoraea sp.]